MVWKGGSKDDSLEILAAKVKQINLLMFSGTEFIVASLPIYG
jgi:hypothetical protein